MLIWQLQCTGEFRAPIVEKKFIFSEYRTLLRHCMTWDVPINLHIFDVKTASNHEAVTAKICVTPAAIQAAIFNVADLT
jgi:hypothetical protein